MRQAISRQPPIAADVVAVRSRILEKLTYALGKDARSATDHDWFFATALAVRDLIVERWMDSNRGAAAGKKTVHYLSIEFLIGRLLFDAVMNLNQLWPVQKALAELGVDFDRLRQIEPDAALGSGGLGRLAACFMDSMASLDVPAYGYGIRYQLGLFKQRIQDGWQHELPDDWLAFGNPWEFERSDVVYPIRFGGHVEYIGNGDDTARGHWYPGEILLAQACDMPVLGWRATRTNTLRLWSARAIDSISPTMSDKPDYRGAMEARAKADQICRNLYPDDSTPEGRELRLRQEYFFTSASIQDVVARHLKQHESLSSLPDTAAIQLNDTHPAIAVAELMRILVDEHECSWSKAWAITRGVLNYTNHTLLPEALESWPSALMNRLLPRHMQIIYLINHHHLSEAVARGHTDGGTISAISLIGEGGEQRVRMGHLAFVGSGRVNGVSALHTELMQQTTFRDLETVLPGRIVNKTNGISARRWLLQANPGLTALLEETIGGAFLDNLEALHELKRFARDGNFIRKFTGIRVRNKAALTRLIREVTGIETDPTALFDVQVKRIHEYKRQLLNILETIALYQSIRARPDAGWIPRVKIFAGKAAASYARAKLIIKLAHDVGRLVNSDPAIGNLLKVVFLPNYSVSLAEAIVPAADLSEQISTAGMEASGTGNMKLALNGALTIGTLDGANVEIRDRVGTDNIFIFGLTAEQVEERRRARFTGAEAAETSSVLKTAVDGLAQGMFSPGDPLRYKDLAASLLDYDHFMVAADFDSYWRTQRKVDEAWKHREAWWTASILNVARMGWFSSDRTIHEYAREIWHITA